MEISWSCCDYSVLAEEDTVHLLDIEFRLVEKESEGDTANLVSFDLDILLHFDLPAFDNLVAPVYNFAGGTLNHFGIGNAVLDMMILVASNS